MSSITKEVIFYADGTIEEPIKSMAWDSIVASGLGIHTSYLQLGEVRGILQMMKQIVSCLERSTADYVFFTEHDVVYPKSHFDFTPTRDDIFYYNENVWRWDYPQERYITYDRLLSLSALCVNRLFALDHFKRRLETARQGWDHRKMGYEPGTKKIKRGGFSDDDFDVWRSVEPIIDIRHGNTLSPRKVHLENFTHKPTGWREIYERPV